MCKKEVTVRGPGMPLFANPMARFPSASSSDTLDWACNIRGSWAIGDRPWAIGHGQRSKAIGYGSCNMPLAWAVGAVIGAIIGAIIGAAIGAIEHRRHKA